MAKGNRSLSQSQTTQISLSAEHLPPVDKSGSTLPIALLAAGAAVVILRLAGYRQETDSFCAFFFAITLSAIPYITFGAVFSGLSEVFLPPDFLVRIAKRLGPFGIPLTALAAPVFPICECGVVVVVRGLLRKGMPLPYALTYLLAAPIVNPIVMASTYMAFQSVQYALFRLLGGLFVSITIGLLFSRLSGDRVFEPGLIQLQNDAGQKSCKCDSHGSKWKHLIEHIRRDFLDMMPYFLIGVFAASAMKTLFSDNALAMASGSRIAGPAVMMLMAFVLSLCSEADAFPAASFTGFSFTAHMAFLVLGPMLDIKLMLMYRSVFRTRFIFILAASILAAVTAYLVLIGLLL